MPRLYTHTLINLQVFEGLLVMSACPGSDWSITCRLVPDFSAYIYIYIHTKLTHMLKLCVLTWAHRWNESSSHTGHTIGLQRRGHANMPKRCVEFFTCVHMCYWCLNRLEGLDRSYRYLLGDNFGRGQIVENRVMDKSSHECISMKYNHITHASDIVHAIQHPPAGT